MKLSDIIPGDSYAFRDRDYTGHRPGGVRQCIAVAIADWPGGPVRRGVLVHVERTSYPGCPVAASFTTERRHCPDCGQEHLVHVHDMGPAPQQATEQEMINPAVILRPWAEHERLVMQREADALARSGSLARHNLDYELRHLTEGDSGA